MKKAIFIQPRHFNAPETGLGHVYLPTSVFMAASRVLAAGGDVRCYDENLRQVPSSDLATAEVIGTHTTGTSLLPCTLDLTKRIENEFPNIQLVHGGQQISSLDVDPRHNPVRFKRLFGEAASNGNFDEKLAASLDIRQEDLPDVESTSIIPVLEKLSDSDLRTYLSAKSMSLYVAQGCNKACSFCTAVRTRKTPEQTPLKNLVASTPDSFSGRVKEVYRDIDVTKKDLSYLVGKASELGVSALTIYMSNLDICQTPEKLYEFAQAAIDVKKSYPDVKMKLTALATIAEFKLMDAKHQ